MVEHRFEGDLGLPACLLAETARVGDDGRGFGRTKPLGICLDAKLDARARTKGVQQRLDAATGRLSRRCRSRRPCRAPSATTYARTTSRTSVKSRRDSRLPTRIDRLDQTALDERDLTGHARRHEGWRLTRAGVIEGPDHHDLEAIIANARSANCSCASLLSAYGLAGASRVAFLERGFRGRVHRRGARDEQDATAARWRAGSRRGGEPLRGRCRQAASC